MDVLLDLFGSHGPIHSEFRAGWGRFFLGLLAINGVAAFVALLLLGARTPEERRESRESFNRGLRIFLAVVFVASIIAGCTGVWMPDDKCLPWEDDVDCLRRLLADV